MIRLTDLLSEGLGPSSSMIKKIEDFLKKELKVSNVKGKKYSQGRARQGYTFYPEGTKNGLYIDQAYDGIWNIYTVGANGFPINNHWEIKKYEDDIEDEATALNAAFDVIKKFGKTLKESVNEEFTAVSNKSGKTVVFKNKDARDAAVKAGTHSKEDEKDGGDEPKGEKKPNMFSKDAGYDAPDADKSEPKDSSGGRAGNPQVNKATRQKAKELGITPENLGREEYELKMVQAAHEALTDSNFHSEARKLIAIMEDNPELAKNPSLDPNKPDLGEPGYDDWVKTTAWGSKYGDSSDETDELGRAASNEAGWDGKDALDGIAFELKMRGFKDLALKIQSVFDEKNEGTIKLTNLI